MREGWRESGGRGLGKEGERGRERERERWKRENWRREVKGRLIHIVWLEEVYQWVYWCVDLVPPCLDRVNLAVAK